MRDEHRRQPPPGARLPYSLLSHFPVSTENRLLTYHVWYWSTTTQRVPNTTPRQFPFTIFISYHVPTNTPSRFSASRRLKTNNSVRFPLPATTPAPPPSSRSVTPRPARSSVLSCRATSFTYTASKMHPTNTSCCFSASSGTTQLASILFVRIVAQLPIFTYYSPFLVSTTLSLVDNTTLPPSNRCFL